MTVLVLNDGTHRGRVVGVGLLTTKTYRDFVSWSLRALTMAIVSRSALASRSQAANTKVAMLTNACQKEEGSCHVNMFNGLHGVGVEHEVI